MDVRREIGPRVPVVVPAFFCERCGAPLERGRFDLCLGCLTQPIMGTRFLDHVSADREHSPGCPAFGRAGFPGFDPEECEPALCAKERQRILFRRGIRGKGVA